MYEIAINAFDSFVGQLFPTLGGQVSRIIDPTRRNAYYYDKTKQAPKWVQALLHKTIMSKIPGLSYYLPEKIDAWGRVQRDDSNISRFLQNFLSPGYWKKQDTTEVDAMLQELYDQTGEASIFPDTAATYFTVDHKRYDMSAKEYVEYAKTQGQTSYKIINKMIDTPQWRGATPEQRVKWIENTYKYAKAFARENTDSGYSMSEDENTKWYNKAKKSGNPAKFIMTDTSINKQAKK